ncbi:GlcG/HbpS family heme-binding protein [Deinococcus arenicola]|uniref:Heme-binding protein n=1 Tax=Deinococcus arenicola TaxID=2994950 RepID=A0ABU4DXA0_9DEIO|nr:heme-binding protein [Deinococcus sp. ZS9-10]MDV6376309.1 heme-binding protein [Deinococcus sp. ZS9-10]
MKTILTALLTSALSLAAAQTTPAPIKLATTATVSTASLSLSAASRIAMLAVNNCAQLGYNVSATVVDRSGVTLAVARSENAGPHTLGASQGKAFTSASARNLTGNIAKGLETNPGLADIPGYLVLAGGAPINVGGAVVGAVGVGGAPSGLVDEKCGTDAVATVLSK